MGHDHAAPNRQRPSTTYCLRVRGPLPAALAGDLDGFTVQAGPTTTLTGPVTDPADLYGLIARLERLGLTLLSLQATDDGPATPPLADLDPPNPGKEHDDE